ncbi:molybdopterin molybdotransferase MoeA [Bacillus chungangensis]|uniref:Molybdopterin molybdenumtransferase n=1 Tax=Bacillus chungangensis TaxID=587633 RepID=A0ABT9WXH4_9BACI|nr:gephyrin-like molybdotransferase Glp [Bacillus chungangensis]MDQ0177465.1 molybdopterin molybdotransferase [Bacillus chungangensis]
MVERRRPIFVKDAIDKVMEQKRRGQTEILAISDCEDRFLAEPIIATHDVPPFDRSPYDGFAIRSIDTEGCSSTNPLQFKVIDEIGAGQVSNMQVREREAIRIMTGAAIPKGADAVVMLELVKESESDRQKFITLSRMMKENDNISFKGEDTRKGTELIEKGTLINPGVKALLATFGYHKVKVAKKPVLGLIATGSELLDVSEPLQPGKIRNSNGPMIEAQIKRAGGSVRKYDLCQDDLPSLYQMIHKAIEECDMVITTGGVSVGDFDYLPHIYEQLQAQLLFNKIGMRPGSVTSVAEKEGKLLFGLSGNPSACYVGFELYVRPIIRYWLHSNKPFLKSGKAYLQKDFPKANPFHRFVRSSVDFSNGKLCVEPVGLDKSNVVTSLAWANSLMVLPGGTRGYKQGDVVNVLFLEEQRGSAVLWEEIPKSSR